MKKVQRRIVQKFDRDSILDQKYKLRAAWARERGQPLFLVFFKRTEGKYLNFLSQAKYSREPSQSFIFFGQDLA